MSKLKKLAPKVRKTTNFSCGSKHSLLLISGTLHRYRLDQDDHLFKAFQHIDKDSSG
ncbi:unnamed protein product [Brassica rapa subsp. narinosa]